MKKSDTKKYEIDMTHGPLLGKVLLFSLPLAASSVLELLFNAADIVVVGRFTGDMGSDCVAAVGSTSSTINLLVSLLIGISVGVNVLTARYFASHQDRNVSETVHTAIMLSILGGALMGLVGVIFSRAILSAMSTPDSVLGLASTYMMIYFAGLPVLAVYNMGAAVLRAIGDTRRPLYYLVASGILNVALNLFFVIVCQLNVAGVALATVISESLSAFLVLRCLARSDESYRFSPRLLGISKSKLLGILEIGLPAGIQSALFSFSNMLIQSSINEFGSTAMAGGAAAGNLEGFVYMSMNSVYQACVSFTSQNYGIGDRHRVNRVVFTCVGVVSVIGLVVGNGFYLFSRPLLSIYLRDAAAIPYGIQRMSIICCPYFICGIMDTICGSMRGLGYSTVPMIVSLMGACVFRIIWISTAFQLDHTLATLYISYPISWTLTASCHLICFFIFRKLAFRKLQASRA